MSSININRNTPKKGEKEKKGGMGFATPYEVWVQPFIRDGFIFFPLLVGWFILHYVVHLVAPGMIPHFRRFDKKTQQDVVVRIVSIVNGAVMCTSFPIFMRNAINVGISPYNDLYREIPEYRVYRIWITSYFFWDTAVCIIFRWGLSWQIHGMCSLIGTFFLMFPMCDDLSSYYGGCFEGTNPLLHLSVILRIIADACKAESSTKSRDIALKKKCEAIATILEYLFGLGFFIIRVLGGTVITFCCVSKFSRALFFDWTQRLSHEPLRSHDDLVLVLCIVACTGVQLLQYIWFVAIIAKGLGMDKRKATQFPKIHKAPENTERTNKVSKKKK